MTMQATPADQPAKPSCIYFTLHQDPTDPKAPRSELVIYPDGRVTARTKKEERTLATVVLGYHGRETLDLLGYRIHDLADTAFPKTRKHSKSTLIGMEATAA